LYFNSFYTSQNLPLSFIHQSPAGPSGNSIKAGVSRPEASGFGICSYPQSRADKARQQKNRAIARFFYSHASKLHKKRIKISKIFVTIYILFSIWDDFDCGSEQVPNPEASGRDALAFIEFLLGRAWDFCL
jgi:hypothetical protein